MSGAPPSLDPQDLFVDFIYTSAKTAGGNILLFLDSQSLGRIHQTSRSVDNRWKTVRLKMLIQANQPRQQTDTLEAAWLSGNAD